MAERPRQLSRKALREERAALAAARGKRKLDLILDSADPKALVRSLPAEDLYFAIQEIGKADAAPLVQLASPAQFRTFLDLDVWRENAFDAKEALFWLRLARDEDDEAFHAKLDALNVEVKELLLRGLLKIYDLEEDGEPPDDVEGTVERTPEGRFMLVYDEKGAEYAATRRLVDELYARDPFQAGRLLYAVRWELESELTETALRWRNARLANLGFPSLDEALSLYAKVDLKEPLPPPGGLPAARPGFFLAGVLAGSLLDRALAALTPDAADRVQLQLVTVLNMALVADRIDFTDLDAVREHAEAVRDTIALGLAELAGGDDPEAAAILLATTAVKRIFQVGFTRTLELQWRAKRLVDSLPLRLPHGAFLPESPEGDLLEALLLRRPRYHTGLDEGERRPRPRAFATLEQLRKASATLNRIETVGRLFAAAGLDAAAAAERVRAAWGAAGLARVRYGHLWSTAMARQVAGLPFAFEPLPADRLAPALERSFGPDGQLLPAFVEGATAAWVERCGAEREEAARAWAREALQRLEEELGPQVAAQGFGGVDPRFASPLVVPVLHVA